MDFGAERVCAALTDWFMDLGLVSAGASRTHTRQDPCVLDTFISAVRFIEEAPARPWWSYTAERKKKFPASSLGAASHAIGSAKAGPPSRKIATAHRRK